MKPILLVILFCAGLLGCETKLREAGRVTREGEFGGHTGVEPGLNIELRATDNSSSMASGGKPTGESNADLSKVPEIERKLIQTGRIEVAAENFESAQNKVEAVIQEAHAIIISSEFTGIPGRTRSGTWMLKVEPAKFQSTVSQLVALGRIMLHKTDSQDVTEEFFDLQARVKNLKAEEETLNRLLKENARTTQDVLEFRKNILQLRGDIERAEGRLNVLGRLTALSTIYFTLKEEKAFEPAKKEVDPKPATYRERSVKSFDRAWKNLTEFLTGLTEFAIEFLVWSPVIIPGTLLALYAIRQLRRNSSMVLFEKKGTAKMPKEEKSTLDLLSEMKEEGGAP